MLRAWTIYLNYKDFIIYNDVFAVTKILEGMTSYDNRERIK
jgi:hypothetical protein